ncbi:MAG: DUF2237 domain-containing protein [Pyrinomonadaceae bacterium]
MHEGIGNGTKPKAKNVMGGELAVCCTASMTGCYRNGKCDTGAEDHGVHTVCVEVTAEFLEFSRSRGNDLSSPMPGFPISSPATSGVCAHRGGKKRSTPESRPRSCSKPRTERRYAMFHSLSFGSTRPTPNKACCFRQPDGHLELAPVSVILVR